MRCYVLVKKESRKFQDSENFQRSDCSLGFKEVFCKISRNYIHKQRNSAEFKKLSHNVARSRGALWARAKASLNVSSIRAAFVFIFATFQCFLNFPMIKIAAVNRLIILTPRLHTIIFIHIRKIVNYISLLLVYVKICTYNKKQCQRQNQWVVADGLGTKIVGNKMFQNAKGIR